MEGKAKKREKVIREATEEKCKRERLAVVFKRACCEFPSCVGECVFEKGFGGGSGGIVERR